MVEKPGIDEWADDNGVPQDVCPHCGGPSSCKACAGNVQKAGTSRKDNTLTAVLPIGADPDRQHVADMLKARGYNPDHWEIVSLTVNQWEGIGKDTTPVVLHQTKATLRLITPVEETDWGRFVAALKTVGTSERRKPRTRLKPADSKAGLVMLHGDDQAPFINWPLHELTCEALQDIRPAGMVYMGDGPDFERLSPYRKDGTKYAAAVQESLDTLHRVLAERVEAAAPSGDLWYLLGNHEERLTKELRGNIPALLGLRRANSEGPSVLSVEYLTRLTELGFQAAKDERGDYLYGKVQLTPDLVASHGWVIRKGAGASARASVEHLNASIIVGHTHRLAIGHITRWSADDKPVIQTVAETGTMAELSGLGYARYPDWQPGWLTATIRSDGSHHLDAAVYRDGVLRWRDSEWRLTARGVRRSN